MIRFYLVCLPYWIFVDYIFVRLNLSELPANNLRRISTMYVRGYLQGSENGRVVTIGPHPNELLNTRMFGYENYKHRYIHMAASNKYKCTQTHSKYIWYVLLTYNKYILSNILLVILFIYLILFKKKEKKSKTWPLTTN